MKKEKVGLALGGGGARGVAHIGVLEILEKSSIPIDMIAGTSAGAAVGAIYAQGKGTDGLKKLAKNWNWIQRAQTVDLALPHSGFIAGGRIKKLLKSIIGDVSFDDLKTPFACVATDILTGEEVVIDRGSVLEAVRASISVPVIFSIVKYGGRHLVDGGLVNPVPVSVLKAMGADFVIAVNVTPRLDRNTKAVYLNESDTKIVPKVKEPNIFSVIMKTFSITNSQLVEASLKGADVIIEPRMTGIGMADFSHAEKCITEGSTAAIDAVLEIKRRLAS
ncbi:MAG TPA: patatin family protein [Dehalococcoidia bacterium]|nr:patatin family protein [Dehalococcoidia bacterium]